MVRDDLRIWSLCYIDEVKPIKERGVMRSSFTYCPASQRHLSFASSTTLMIDHEFFS